MPSLLTSAFAQLAERLAGRAEASSVLDSRTCPMRRPPTDPSDELATVPGLLQPPSGFRLTRWPRLPSELRTARTLGALSVMSHRWVSPRWFARQVGCTPADAERFLASLVRAGYARRIGD